MRILNAYAGIGGNRRLWAGHNVTAVEFNPEIAAIYQALYPEDTVIVADAHEFIREHHAEFDFKGKRQILRNCVAPTDGLAILTAALEARP